MASSPTQFGVLGLVGADLAAVHGDHSEIAAHWQFADGSHFIRAFKKQYGQTPTAYARSTGPRSLRDRDVCGCRRTRVCAKC